MTTKTERLITPELAQQWLALSTGNRRLSKGNLAKLTRDMREGRFHDIGDPFRFVGYLRDGSAELIDGHHRLMACAASGVSFYATVIEGLSSDRKVVIDTGKSRSFANVLEFNNVPRPGALAAAVRLAWQIEHGDYSVTGGGGGGHVMTITNDDLLVWLEKNPEIGAAVLEGERLRKDLGIAPSAAIVAVWMLRRLNAQDADEFLTAVRTGLNLHVGSPALALAKWFFNQARQRHTERAVHQLAVFIKAWNAYREGRTLRTVRWAPYGQYAEPFPEPK